MGPNFMDEIDCGNFFDQIDDLIEFPSDNECADGRADLVSSDGSKGFPMWNDAFPESEPLFSSSHVSTTAADLSAELSVPYEDIVQLEWLSTFVEDSFSGQGMTLAKENLRDHKKPSPLHSQFQISSPVSVLESSSSSSSSSGEKTIPPLSPNQKGPQRARSKRPRPATFNPRAAIQLISPSSPLPQFIETPRPFFPSEFENFADSKNFPEHSGPGRKKKPKKIKTTAPPLDSDEAHKVGPDNVAQPPPLRKCMHCGITKTPQWRAGPLGPKTLCNACGVRHKSGRLFPEYRPAASPTFMPALHSNSHKKVLEMRSKVVPEIGQTTTKPDIAP